MEQEKWKQQKENQNQRWWLFSIAAGLISALVVLLLLFRNNRQKQQANALLSRQKDEINLQRNMAEQALNELKSTQAQLIQSEKMASLGELTAGIAHEIQNPLNFVNNFSEINFELINELKNERIKGIPARDESFQKEIIQNIEENSLKISHHGKRAESIVKGMLLHSQKSSGSKELTDINALTEEYLRIAYHGYRAKNANFSAALKVELDPSLPLIPVVPQDIGRVVLNLINNAFYAVNEKYLNCSTAVVDDMKKQHDKDYEPTVTVSTEKGSNIVFIAIKDNGKGIPNKVLDKIFQPFFTTKPTGQGTGLGLSLSYDIVKSHGGDLTVRTEEGRGSEFVIQLPVI